MAVKHLKPTSAGRRWQTISDFSEITCTKPEKSLLEPLPKKAGRNNNGRITTRHQGGGVKRRYRDRVRSEPFRSHRSAALR